MKTKHTPGEWRATGLEIRHKNRGLILANVYEHNPNNQTREEAEANARLIAAAPELLDALEKFTMLNPEHYKDIAGFIANAKEVITKATNP